MRKSPTDLQLLEHIYEEYYDTYAAFDRANPSRKTKVIVPIDVKAIAAHFGVDHDIVFGRLYYHLDPKYRFRQDDGAKVSFFLKELGDEKMLIQFPMLAAVIAQLREEREKHLVSTWLSVAAVIISAISLLFALPACGSDKKEPNKALVPTTTAVTPAANAPVAPAAVAAHL